MVVLPLRVFDNSISQILNLIKEGPYVILLALALLLLLFRILIVMTTNIERGVVKLVDVIPWLKKLNP